jgi:hypothetical protein
MQGVSAPHAVGPAWWVALAVATVLILCPAQPRMRLWWVALFAAALALRLLLGSWVPFHINGSAGRWLDGALVDAALLRSYGPGYAELFAVAARFPSPDTAIFAANAALASLIPVWACALAGLAGVDRVRALLAGAWLAADVVAIRFAATESYFPALIALSAGALVAFAAAGQCAARKQPVRAAVLAAAAVTLLVQMVRIHPVGWAAAALAPLAAGCAAGLSARQRLRLALGACALAAAGVWLWDGGVIAANIAEMAAQHGSARLKPPGNFVPIALLLVPWLWMGRPRALVLLAAAALLLDDVTRHVYVQSVLWQASHDRLYSMVPVVALVALVPPRPRALAVFAVAVLALMVWRGGPALRMRTTEEREYPWLRAELARLPAGSRAAWVAAAGRFNMFVPAFVAPAGAGPPITVWLHTSLCEHADAAAACRAVEEPLALSPLARARLPAKPSRDGDDYRGDEVEISLSALRCE